MAANARRRRFLAELAAGLAGIAADETVERAVVAYRVELPDWRNDAACRGHSALFFADSVHEPEKVDAAKAICAGCPVVTECGDAADGEYGIWAGRTERERTRARRRRQVA